jgi:RNA polymerase sigma-70 factor (ECF subfamily)
MSVQCCDRALVLRAKSGEQSAFDALTRKYWQRVMNLSIRYTRNRADAEDAVQNTFINAYWGLQHYRGDAAFYSWLHRIAVNSAKTILSLRRRDANLLSSDWREGAAATATPVTPSHLDTPEKLALADEICAIVNATIEELSEEQRIAIVLRELQGLSYTEVASAMSCPIGTVRSRVFRAREAIHNRLRQIFDEGLGRSSQCPHYLPKYRSAYRVTDESLTAPRSTSMLFTTLVTPGTV